VSTVKRWNVLRVWWEFTKLILRGGAGYDVYVRVGDLSDDAQEEFDCENWRPYYLDWTDSRDHFAVLSAQPDGGER
jgi:hypothetical protein